MIISSKVFFENKGKDHLVRLTKAVDEYPDEYRKMFLKNARNYTPRKTGWLRRSIITQVLGNTVKVGWRARYAAAVNAGQHTVERKVTVDLNHVWEGPGTNYRILDPGVYVHRTGSKGFIDRTKDQTQRDMDNLMKGKLAR